MFLLPQQIQVNIVLHSSITLSIDWRLVREKGKVPAAGELGRVVSSFRITLHNVSTDKRRDGTKNPLKSTPVVIIRLKKRGT